jgi:hypothetical protein
MEIILIKSRKPMLPAGFSGTMFNTKKEWAGHSKLKRVWEAMIDRCYNKNGNNFWTHMNAGITVHPNWHNPRNFMRTIVDVPQWHLKLENWENYVLDKDYYGAGQYGPSTCAWLSKEENSWYTTKSVPLVVTKCGVVNYYPTISVFSRELLISPGTVHDNLDKGYIDKGILEGYQIDTYKGELLIRHKLSFNI